MVYAEAATATLLRAIYEASGGDVDYTVYARSLPVRIQHLMATQDGQRGGIKYSLSTRRVRHGLRPFIRLMPAGGVQITQAGILSVSSQTDIP